MTRLSLDLLDWTWMLAVKIVVLVAVTDLACRTIWRTSAAKRHLGWTLCCIGLLVVFVGSTVPPPWAIHVPGLAHLSRPDIDGNAKPSAMKQLPAHPIPALQNPESGIGTGQQIEPRTTQDTHDSAHHDRNSTVAGPFLTPSETAARDGAIPSHLGSSDRLERPNLTSAGWQPFVATAWLCGAVILLCQHARAHFAAYNLCRRAEPAPREEWLTTLESLRTSLAITRPVRLLISNEVSVPVTFGVWRPCVILPRASLGWNSECCRVALLHELAHVKRFDTATQAVGYLASALLWWHPLTWYAAARQRSEQERACDEMVLVSGCLASTYAEHLVRIAQELSGLRTLPSTSVAMIRTSSRLRGRVDEVLSPHRRRALTLRSTLLPLGLATLMTAAAICIVPKVTAQNTGGDSRDRAPSAVADGRGRRRSDSRTDSSVAPTAKPPAPTSGSTATSDNTKLDGTQPTLPQHAIRRYGTTGVLPHLANPKTAVSADGRLAATFDPGDTVTLWDVAADREIATLVSPPNPYRHEERLLFSPDGEKLLANIGVKFQMWDVAQRRLVYEIPQERKYRMIAAAFSPDGAIVAGSSEDRGFTVHVWDTASGAELLTLPVPQEYDMVTSLAISPDGNLFAAATREGDVPIWDLAAGKQLRVLDQGEPVGAQSLIFSPDGRWLYFGEGHTAHGLRRGRDVVEISAWDVLTGERALEFKRPQEWQGAAKLGLSRDGKELYSLHQRRFAVWDAVTGTLKRVIDPERLGPPVGPPDKIITMHGNWSNLERYSIDSRDQLVAHAPVIEIQMAQLSDDGQRLVTTGNGSVHVWDAATGAPIHSLGDFMPGGHSVQAIAEVSSTGLVFAVGTLYDRQQPAMLSQVRAWERDAGSLHYAVRVDGRAQNLAISPDGTLLAVLIGEHEDADDVFSPPAGSTKGAIEILDPQTGKRVAIFNAPSSDRTALQFSPTSEAIASIAGSTFQLHVIHEPVDVLSGIVERAFELKGHRWINPPDAQQPGAIQPTEVYAAAIAPNLRWVATTGLRDERVFIWDAERGVKQKELIIPGMATSTLAISPDSRLLAVSVRFSHDHDSATKNSISLWDLVEGRQLLALEPDPSELPAFITFSPDGKHLLSASGTSSAILWDLSAAYVQLGK
jgi:WD40 repeat protein/beta-lactamase regulating signal transducer with metallopeptidase domain